MIVAQLSQALPDIPRELTGIAEWSACLVYVLLLRKRMRRRRLVPLLALGLAAQIGVQMLAGQLPLSLWSFGMAMAVAVMFVTIWSAARITVREAGYFCARALVLAELVAALHWQLHCYFFVRDGQQVAGPLLPRALVLVLVYVGAFVLAWVIESRHFRPDLQLDISRRDLASAAAIAGVTFLVSNLSFMTVNSPFSGRLGLEIFYIRTLVDLCGFVALYAQQGQHLQQRAAAELRAIDEILRTQHEQYLVSKRSMDRINRKYHDLKHQIGVIRAEADPGRKAAFLDDLEASVQTYEQQARTGNGVLDVLLTTKSLAAAERDIDLTCVADGRALDFLSVMDICTVVGNALDNAIEGAQAVPDPDKRLVTLALHSRNGLTVFTVENYYTGELRTEHGQIVTRHADRDSHGYGLKSIRYTAEKYGGSMTVHAADQWFSLRVLLPAPEGRQR
ncbi:ATP-binding protein [Cellulomonas denverensis]|uniref:Sensor histidine kinase n=1 Tax=Cellulomonas denverensis TaxID=264297 RepID=A0A7X6KU25_9CELL|nr:ATP-binding protein [Cellulomonas denverensis]NKY21994.1 sensor histidine kinase [Cellulomonas denverensis]GIG24113.1 sensor histidine kinase [Cellulomonas denverensis]